MGNLELRAFEIEFNRPITKRERSMVNIVGKVFLGNFIRPGWSGEIDFYLFMCDNHGLVADYPHFHSQILRCPLCQDRINKDPEPTICQEELDNLKKELRDMEQK